MILSWLSNLNLKCTEAQYLDTFYKMLKYTNNEDIHYAITEEYLKEYKDTWANTLLDYDSIDFGKINKTILPIPAEQKMFLPLKDKLRLYNKNTNESIYKQLEQDIKIKDHIDFIITWINNKTLSKYAKGKNIPLIHNELGPLRPNLWKDSIYLDFSGVNSNTEFEVRFQNFMKVSDKLNLLPYEELLDLVALDKEKVFEIHNNRNKSDKVGVALQVARDSNLLMYSDGWDTISLLSYVYEKYGKENLLIKNHPYSDLQQTGDFEFANTSIELLMRSKKVITINSSMAFEAFLLDKDVEILGNNPFKCIVNLKGEEKLKALNFAVISYLLPSYLLFNKEFYNFRINCKDEFTIYNEHLKSWKNYDKLI